MIPSLAPHATHSRIHRLDSFTTDAATVFVKREDEIGPLSMGIKVRKYLSLLPYLLKIKKKVAITGSIYSNNVLALSTFCRQYKIPYVLVLDKPRQSKRVGNAFYLLLAHGDKDIIWLDKTYTQEHVAQEQPDLHWLPLGGSCKESLEGSLTIASDILENEKEEKIVFDHIFTDSGTGFSASTLHAGLSHLHHKAHIHVVQVAGKMKDFLSMHEKVWQMVDDTYTKNADRLPLHCYLPSESKSFGAISKNTIEFITRFARDEGIFLDPMYNAKLFFTAKKKIEELQLKGNILIIHSGGTLALSGFSDLFQGKTLSN